MSAQNTNAHRAIGDRGPQRSFAVMGRAEAQVARWSKAPAIATLLLNAMIMHSCTAMRSTPLVNHQSHISNQQLRIDSVYLRDSIYIREYTLGDTVYIDRWHDRWRDHETIHTDTLLHSTTDTVYITSPSRGGREGSIPRFYQWCTALFWIICVGICVYIGLRIIKVLYLR